MSEKSSVFHLGGCHIQCNDHNTFLPDIWERLIREYGIKSVLDIGMGAGWNTVWFHEQGLDAYGVEGWAKAIMGNKMPAHRIIPHDYENGMYKPKRSFDLAWSSEFVEHVQEEFIPNYLATFQACRFACITFATPGQTGYHHVNEQLEDYWILKLAGAGFAHRPETTAWMRATHTNEGWGRQTLTFFENRYWQPFDRQAADRETIETQFFKCPPGKEIADRTGKKIAFVPTSGGQSVFASSNEDVCALLHAAPEVTAIGWPEYQSLRGKPVAV